MYGSDMDQLGLLLWEGSDTLAPCHCVVSGHGEMKARAHGEVVSSALLSRSTQCQDMVTTDVGSATCKGLAAWWR